MAAETINVQVRAEQIKRELGAFLDKLTAKVALDVHANLVRAPSEGGTPVDTGWARANWIPRIRDPVTAPVGARPPSGQTFVDTGAQEAGKAEVATGYRIDLGPIYVSNAVPYIGELNDGSSKQAPAGFVQAAITKALVEDIAR